ncbi:MAG: uracil-DNA glycosylase [Oligoflexia bacterium]|nr:uracil-DNA glycosylase [Oligoflexia bacterium]
MSEELKDHLNFFREVLGIRNFLPGPAEFSQDVPVAESGELAETPSLSDLQGEAENCQRCPLGSTRTKSVFGTGPKNSPIMFIGEAPGEDEDRVGIPFVGPSGQLLTKMIEAMGLTRDQVYLANIVKCRPPENRTPKPEEVVECGRFLNLQIKLVNPKIVVALGAVAAQTLLATTKKISECRGQLVEKNGIKVLATFHPSYLLRNPKEKKTVWQDLQIVMEQLGLPRPKVT